MGAVRQCPIRKQQSFDPPSSAAAVVRPGLIGGTSSLLRGLHCGLRPLITSARAPPGPASAPRGGLSRRPAWMVGRWRSWCRPCCSRSRSPPPPSSARRRCSCSSRCGPARSCCAGGHAAGGRCGRGAGPLGQRACLLRGRPARRLNHLKAKPALSRSSRPGSCTQARASARSSSRRTSPRRCK